MSYRELWVLVSRLPIESWTQTVLRDQPREELEPPERPEQQQFGQWALDNYQLAMLIDAVNHNSYVTAKTSPAWEKYQPIKPLPRPGLRKEQTKELPPAAKKYLEGLRATG